MAKIDFDQFLVLNERDFDSFQKAFYYIKDYIEAFKDNNFEFQMIADLEGLIDKFLQFGEPIKSEISTISLDLIKHLQKLRDDSHNYESSTVTDTSIQNHYQDFYSSFLLAYNKISLYLRENRIEDEHLDFDGLISYNISNKRTAISLIEEAIELVKTDSNISEKSKQTILKYLTDTINELLSPQSNWNTIWSRMSEVMIVLGTLGAIISGVDAANNLLSAKSKLENAKDIIIKTSINLNYYNIEQTFEINKNIAIENNKLVLPESTE